MALSAFSRMHSRLLARLGEQAVLRGDTPCVANIEFGVEVNYEAGDDKFVRSEYAAVVDIANIETQFEPKAGDTLKMVVSGDSLANYVFGKTYIIDAIAADNGFMARCVLR